MTDRHLESSIAEWARRLRCLAKPVSLNSRMLRDLMQQSRRGAAQRWLQAAVSTVGGPVGGSLRLLVNTASPKVAAATGFSIFVVLQNPFDVPVTIHQVQTHIALQAYLVLPRNPLSNPSLTGSCFDHLAGREAVPV